jgi:uncharacterized protein YajQ (UPF0234 family)
LVRRDFLESHPTMPSFDTVCEADFVEVKNAVENAAKEIGTRFDFKGTSAAVELKDKEITMFGDAEFQLTQVEDLLRNKLTKRNVDVRFLDIGKPQKIGGDKVKQVIKVRNGIESELAKKLQKLIKDSKIKVQAAIQEEKVRISGTKRDDLQAAMALIRKDIADMPLSFNNFRD